MSSEKTLAIVLRTIEFSETSLVVTLFTEDFGKITGLAKGARRPKGPFEAALDLLAICRLVFIPKSSGLDLLTEARLEQRYRAATRDLDALYAGYYVAELLRELTDEHDPHPELFQFALETLNQLQANHDAGKCVMRFELVALRQLGHWPSLNLCVGCGTNVERTGRVPFGFTAGGVLCKQCRIGKRSVAMVTAEALQLMQGLSSVDKTVDRTTLLAEKFSPAVWGELRGLVSRYICNMLGHQPRMHNLLPVVTKSANKDVQHAESNSSVEP